MKISLGPAPFFCAMLALLGPAAGATPCPERQYLGSEGARVLTLPGCNASAFAQVPGSSTLFIGRQLLTENGELAPPERANDCSGGNPANQKVGKVFNRWSLMLDKFDWSSGKFDVVKPLLDTSIDPKTGVSGAIITGGQFRGAIVRSAYDPSVAVYGGVVYVAFECTLQNGAHFKVFGTSSCISRYDIRSQTIAMDQMQVIVSGVDKPEISKAAAVPHLLSYSGRLFLYWLDGTREAGQGYSWQLRGAELEKNGNVLSLKGAGNNPASTDGNASTIMWDDERDPGKFADLFYLYTDGKNSDGIYVLSGAGDRNCTAPSGKSPGCYRLSIGKTDQPIAFNAFKSTQAIATIMPTNPVEYAVVIRNPNNNLEIFGHFIRPPNNGLSETMPMPNRSFWDSYAHQSVYAMASLKLGAPSSTDQPPSTSCH